LTRALEAHGFTVWIDQNVIEPRDDLANVIGFGIRASRYGIVNPGDLAAQHGVFVPQRQQLDVLAQVSPYQHGG
jgi:hypothetical protein